MVSAFTGIFSIFCFVFLIELASRQKKISGEVSRKVVHIIIGSFIAFWPFFMSFHTIQILSLALLSVMILSKYLNIFGSIHGVGRATFGELLFPVAIGLVATVTSSEWIFAAAILHMSLADGCAGLIGVHFIKGRGAYKIMGQTKTLIGSLVFLVISAIITAWVVLGSSAGFSQSAWPVVIWLPLAATLLESISPYGLDNLLVPVFITLVLSSGL